MTFIKRSGFCTTLEFSRMHIKHVSKDNVVNKVSVSRKIMTKFLVKDFLEGFQGIRVMAIGCSNS